MKKYNLSFFYIGFGSILSQIILVREFMVGFYGNELSIGIIYSGWMFWIGIGSLLGQYLGNSKKTYKAIFFTAFTISSLLPMLQLVFVKLSRYLLNINIGEFISFFDLFIFAFIVLAPGCLIWGILFSLGAKLTDSENEPISSGVNRVYIIEAIGSFSGGILFSLVLINLFGSFQILTLIFIIAVLILIYENRRYYFSYLKIENSDAENFKKYIDFFFRIKVNGKFNKGIVLFIGVILIFVLLIININKFENQLTYLQWKLNNPGMIFIQSKDTKYQNLSLLQLNDQYTIYSDGKPLYNIPDDYSVETFTHLIMTQSYKPKSVLIIGGGFNGMIKEVLKYKVDNIDYIEPDKELLDFSIPFLREFDRQYLLDQRVEVIIDDGRKYLKSSSKMYDVILINAGEPSTAGLNRFYTLEFFNNCFERLNEDGITAFSFPSSEDYFGRELKNLNASLYSTFKSVFRNNIIIPGVRAIMIGSKSLSPLLIKSDTLARIYRESGIKSEFFSEYLFDQLMPIDRIYFVMNALESVSNPLINSDMNPIVYYFDMVLWNKILKGDNTVFEWIEHLNLIEIAGIIIIPIILIYIFSLRKKSGGAPLCLSMFIFGMTGIIFSLLIILNFQTAFGSIFELIGIMIAVNMLGLSLGSWSLNKVKKNNEVERVFLFIQLLIIISTLLLPLVLSGILRLRLAVLSYIIMIYYSGLIGAAFNIINKIYLCKYKKRGMIYSFDLFGSALGSLICITVLIPALGIEKSCLFISLILICITVMNFISLRFRKRV